MKKLPDRSPTPAQQLLRSIAGLGNQNVHVGAHAIESSVTQIQRDAIGRVIGSVERHETTKFVDVEGDWFN